VWHLRKAESRHGDGAQVAHQGGVDHGGQGRQHLLADDGPGQVDDLPADLLAGKGNG
jgi:hypothetical protein